MKKIIIMIISLMIMSLIFCAAMAEESDIEVTTEYRWFVNQYRNVRTVKVSYYDDVYAYNHGEYGLTPFSSNVPSEYFVKDENGTLAVAPIVLDITDAMRIRLYGDDVGETALLYGQYCERVKGKKGKTGFSGVHEGIDFVNNKGSEIHALLGGLVTKAGDRNGTVAIYNEEYDVTLLYLHCQKIKVKRGDVVDVSDVIAQEGSVAIYAGQENNVAYAKRNVVHVHTSHYTHVEMRKGKHTSSNAYRNTKLESDCPYEVMMQVFGITESGRQPVTAAAVEEARRMREEAEAAARAEAEATPVPTPEPTPEINVIEEVKDASEEGYGFETTPEPQVESTLPPTTL